MNTLIEAIAAHDWGDVHQYELCADSSVGPEKTADMIFEYISQAQNQKPQLRIYTGVGV